MKGVPIRITVGSRDIEKDQVEISRRDTLEKSTIKIDDIANKIKELLNTIQENLFNKAIQFRKENTHIVNSYEEFKKTLKNKRGFISAHWDGTTETELKIKEETKATIRCIPLDQNDEEGICIYSGKSSKRRVIFAEAY